MTLPTRSICLTIGRETPPLELSVLVHEMVHHLQNFSGLRYACPQEREELAYSAQAKWLDQFGLNLIDAFELDTLTVLVRTKCFY